MQILLAVVVISVVEVVILAVAFRAFERDQVKQAREGIERAARAEASKPRFFGDAAARGETPLTLEALLARLERHAKVERQAAEWFIENPTPETLHQGGARPQLMH